MQDCSNGLEGEERKARESLLQDLTDDGVSLEELKAAVAEDRLALLPVERVLGGELHGSQIEAADRRPRPGDPAYQRLLGLPEAGPDDPVFAAADIEAANSIKLFLDAGLPEDAIADTTRVLGESMSRLAATVAGGFVNAFLQPGDTEDEVAMRFATLAERLTPALAPVLVAAFTAHLRESVSRGILGPRSSRAGNSPTRWSSRSASPTWSGSRGSGASSKSRSSGASPVASASSPAR